MAWRRKEPGHQQPWYWQFCRIILVAAANLMYTRNSPSETDMKEKLSYLISTYLTHQTLLWLIEEDLVCSIASNASSWFVNLLLRQVIYVFHETTFRNQVITGLVYCTPTHTFFLGLTVYTFERLTLYFAKCFEQSWKCIFTFYHISTFRWRMLLFFAMVSNKDPAVLPRKLPSLHSKYCGSWWPDLTERVLATIVLSLFL